MLVLSRRPHEGIRIRHDIVVTVLEVSGDKVRIGIEAPANVAIHREEIYLEVKSVSMGEGERSSFPDAVTERGQKHIRELAALKKSGRARRAILFFLVTREGSTRVSAAREIDPEYARLLEEAREEGLEVMVYGIELSREGIRLGAKGIYE